MSNGPADLEDGPPRLTTGGSGLAALVLVAQVISANDLQLHFHLAPMRRPTPGLYYLGLGTPGKPCLVTRADI